MDLTEAIGNGGHPLDLISHQSEDLKDELVSVISEDEHETAVDWYKEQLKRVKEAKVEVNVHLDKKKQRKVLVD